MKEAFETLINSQSETIEESKATNRITEKQIKALTDTSEAKTQGLEKLKKSQNELCQCSTTKVRLQHST